MAVTAWIASVLAPSLLQKPLGLLAHAFAIMTLWRLIGTVEGRMQRHVIDWIRLRIGRPRHARKSDEPDP